MRAANFYPLSPVQEGMLFHALMAPQSAVYVLQIQFPLPRAIDAEVFRETWRRLMRRHAVLRTRFHWEGLKEPVQVVEESVVVPLATLDWRHLEEAEQRRQLAEFLAEDRGRGFDPAKAPLMRLWLLRMRDHRWHFVWTVHHLVLDGWSVQLVIQEALRIYSALAAGREPALAPARPFRNYVVWLRRQDVGAAEAFWRRYLDGFTAPTPLVVDRPARPEAERRAGQGEARMPRTAADPLALERFARRHRLTLVHVGLAAWAILLQRTSGQRDVAFGLVTSGRPSELPEVEQMVGMFVNTLVVRTRLPRAGTLREWLETFRAEQLELLAHDFSPLLKVHGWSQVPRNLPLFETVVTPSAAPTGRKPGTAAGAPPAAAEERGETLAVMDQTHYPLSLELLTRPVLGSFARYNRARFDAATVARLLAQLATLLEHLETHAERPIDELPHLGAAERHQLLAEWLPSPTPVAMAALAHQRVGERAAASPDAVALVCGALCWSYRELDARARRVARHLLARGAGPETVVAILAERGPGFWIAVLGVLGAGAAYLPLDPRHPARRHAQVLAQSKAQLALGETGFLDALAEAAVGLEPAPRLESLDELIGCPAEDEATRPPCRADGQSLAYVIFTSGSTGKPKGAMVHHHGMLNHLWAKIVDLGLEAADSVAQTASQCFDISVWQCLAPLLTGGQVEIFTDEVVLDPDQLITETQTRRTTVLETVPSLLHAMLETTRDAPPALPALRWHLVTGEALPPDLCRAWLGLYPGIPLLNAYGPTECSDDVTHWRIATAPPTAAIPTPIGRAILNTRIHLLDAELAPVAIGVPGELCVAGIAVGRGYLRAPRPTATAFAPHPAPAAAGERLYRTGDLARFRPDGAIEFLGRRDTQVKVRGFRIELGEIETALAEHPAVARAVVLAPVERQTRQRLIAFVVAAEGGTIEGAGIDAGELRAFLKQRLPDYMVPALFEPLAELPLSANGKVDRRALLERARSTGGRREEDFIAPRDEVEQRLAAIWGQLLGLSAVGVRSDFFELGGHSLMAVVLMSEVHKQFGRKLSLASLVESGTIERMAALLRDEPAAVSTEAPPLDPLVPMRIAGTQPAFFCVHPIGGNVGGFRHLARALGPERRFYALQAPTLDEVGPVAPAIETMAGAYVDAIRKVQGEGPYFLGGWSMGGILAFEMARQLQALGQSVGAVVMLDVWSPAVYRYLPDDAYLLYELILTRAKARGLAPGFDPESLARLDPERRLEIVREAGVASGLVPPGLDLGWMQRFFEGFKARRIALQRYQPEPADLPIVQLRVAPETEDQDFLADLRRIGVETDDPTRGWRAFTTRPVEVHVVPGAHETMIEPPQVRALARRLDACLGAAPEAAAAPRLPTPSESTKIPKKSTEKHPMTLPQDLRFAVRRLLKYPGFTLYALITLIIGLGATTAIFSMIQTLVGRAVPYEKPDQIIQVWETILERGIDRDNMSPPVFLDYLAQNDVFESLAAYRSWSFNLGGDDGDPERVVGARVSTSFFSLLKEPPVLGRDFLPDDGLLGAEPVVILSHQLWQNRFDGDERLLGRKVLVDGVQRIVIGVLPADFQMTQIGWGHVWIPLTFTPEESVDRSFRWLEVLGRLEAGVTLGQAQQQMSAIAANVERQYPANSQGHGVRLVPYREEVSRYYSVNLWALLATILFLLLLACVNLATLQMVRGAERRKTIAVQRALGADRRAIVRQLTVESLVLGVVGVIGGVIAAYWILKGFRAALPEEILGYVPGFGQVQLDVFAVVLAVVVMLGTVVAFGLLPALRLSRLNVVGALKEGGATGTSARGRRQQSTLAIAQIALTAVLLMSSALLLRSYLGLESLDPGFVPEHLLTTQIELPQATYPDPAAGMRFYRSLLEELRAQPQIEAIAGVDMLAFSGEDAATSFTVYDSPVRSPDRPGSGRPLVVSPDYFKTMGIRMFEGRDFSAQDAADGPPVIIVNRGMASAFWPNQSALGEKISVKAGGGVVREIVGVVDDVKVTSKEEIPRPQLYLPFEQAPKRRMALVARTSGVPSSLGPVFRDAVRRQDPNIPLTAFKTMDQQIANSLFLRRFTTQILFVFAFVALVLAASGIYGLLANQVRQSYHEVGVRLAIGAEPKNVSAMVLRRGLKLAAIGTVMGVVVALATASLASSLLWGISVADPIALLAVPAVLALITLLASYFPGRSAARVDPLRALRYE